jgi:hypothetical protein
MAAKLIDAENSARAQQAHLLVAISFHFVRNRLGYLEQTLRALAEFRVQSLKIVVFTNAIDAARLHRIFQQVGLAETDATVVIEKALPHPFDLTWAHKRLIVDGFLAIDSQYTHFIYLEDDERLTFENFTYFIAAREVLRPFGLIPAFLRTEWSTERGCYVNNDNMASVDLAQRPFVSAGDCILINVDYPYCGAFILDQELAREYAASRSIDRDRSRELSSWGVRERAAMGLTFERPPAPFIYRVAVPVSIASRTSPHYTWLAHLPSNYADDPKTTLGKIAMKDLFVGIPDMANEVQLSAARA